jgi:hypothetical protein
MSDGERHTGYMLFECVDFYMIRKQGLQAAEVRGFCRGWTEGGKYLWVGGREVGLCLREVLILEVLYCIVWYCIVM